MAYPHRIRLRGPWECEPLDPPARRYTATVPFHPTDAGRWRLRRRFGYPGRIDAHERVWLTVAAVGGRADLRLNNGLVASLNRGGPYAVEATRLLAGRNELVVDLEGSDAELGEVALEVRCTAYLRDVRVWATGSAVHAAGQVVGEAERPLELYSLLDGGHIAYAVVTATPDGTPFHLEGHRPAPRPAREAGEPGEAPLVQVDLVNGATVWYTWVEEWPDAAGPPHAG